METIAKNLIAIPCEDCPLGPDSDYERSKVHFSRGGTITYEPADSNGCGYSLRVADGPRAEQVRKSIIDCDSPQEYRVAKPGLLGKIGLSTEVARDCPAFRVDPTSRRQVTDYFEGQ